VTLHQTIAHPHPDAPAPGQAVTVAEGVLWLRMPLPMALDHVNVYALRDDDGWTLIDTGLGGARSHGAWEQALAGPLAGHPVARVLVTHHHPDHIGAAGWFQSRGAELVTTRTAWLFARMLTLDVQARPTPETVAFWRAAGMPPDMLARRMAERPFNFADVVDPLPLGFTRIADGQVLTLAGRRWHVRTGNGHAPEQATLWSLDDGLVIGADQILPGITPNIGVYATEPDADPLAEWIASCHAFQAVARADHLVLPGHKLPFTGLGTRLAQMIANHDEALIRLLNRLREGPATACDCFDAIFRRRIGAGEYGLALVEAVAHLNHLGRLGQARRTRRDDGAWLWHPA
jgi:glyoxylase-like metal-dependent hydrolase (beta-lactamase superfamily II)